jgi:Clusterin-associated protein-1
MRHVIKVTCVVTQAILRSSTAINHLAVNKNCCAGTICMCAQLSSIKEARALATDITDRGARLFDLLGKEKEARRQRVKAAAFLEAAAAAGGGSSGTCHGASLLVLL